MFERCFKKHVSCSRQPCGAQSQYQHWYRNLYIMRAAIQSTGSQDIQLAWYFHFYQLQDVEQLVQRSSQNHLHSKTKTLRSPCASRGAVPDEQPAAEQLQMSYQCYHLLLSLSRTLSHPHQCLLLSGNAVFSHQNVSLWVWWVWPFSAFFNTKISMKPSFSSST